jgi:hypothetical protein
MKIRVERDGLADAVAWVARSLPSRPPVPVLGGILLDAGNSDALTISGFDYEVSATVGVAATVADGGRTLVSGRLLADITRSLPAQPVEIMVDGARVSITCGSAKFSLPTMPVEDYPQLPAMPPHAGELAGEVFGLAVSQVAVAAGKDDGAHTAGCCAAAAVVMHSPGPSSAYCPLRTGCGRVNSAAPGPVWTSSCDRRGPGVTGGLSPTCRTSLPAEDRLDEAADLR